MFDRFLNTPLLSIKLNDSSVYDNSERDYFNSIYFLRGIGFFTKRIKHRIINRLRNFVVGNKVLGAFDKM